MLKTLKTPETPPPRPPAKGGARVNTVQRRITTASGKVFFKGGRCRCSGRFFFHFDIFRLITRGLIRFRRGSVRSPCSSQSKPSYHASNDPAVLPAHSGSRHFRIWK